MVIVQTANILEARIDQFGNKGVCSKVYNHYNYPSALHNYLELKNPDTPRHISIEMINTCVGSVVRTFV